MENTETLGKIGSLEDTIFIYITENMVKQFKNSNFNTYLEYCKDLAKVANTENYTGKQFSDLKNTHDYVKLILGVDDYEMGSNTLIYINSDEIINRYYSQYLENREKFPTSYD